ncbi:PREDICTED: corticotropin-releasing factor-binding protein [Trachymyrmex cornetzi]|uniref:Corticotropin-releasing factor-binding protein n=1 Tax=Trachymyrmex cornetzi TaxID=471704 RepID=A0A151J0E8_9HYME|nr:PREDICTED: corticotropin-releasing factor-binding protein [Trachymyrmex cornetzi]KYN14986.1 Corticotropin-releasing factor-binding protein [Trachymyrmex cornetzi]
MFSKSTSTILLVITIIVVVGTTFHVAKAAISNDRRQQQITDEAVANILAYEAGAKSSLEVPREHYRPITDCMFVTSESGPFSYISPTDDDNVCGIYFLTDPDRVVEIHFHSFDVPCDHRGLLAVIDGWEMNGEVFPSENDHSLSMKERTNEFCGKNKWYRRTFTSSQNAALLQYRVPLRGKGFVISARYQKNPRPCNVLSVSTTDPFTLRNYGRRINCTLMAVYPGVVQIIALGIGGSSHGIVHTTETGTLHKCNAGSPRDQVQIGGSRGFDTIKLDVIDSICGIDSKPDIKELVVYDVTVVRLLSSGYYDNSVTVAISPIVDNSLLDSASGL